MKTLEQVDTTDLLSSTPSSDGKTAAAHRSCSTPPTGTAKADDAAGAVAKARAVAALQRLFFEEMSKQGQDANGAAARALLRLSEAPSLPAMSSSQSVLSTGCENVTSTSPVPTTATGSVDDDDEAPDAVEEAPARCLPSDAKHLDAGLEHPSVSFSSKGVMPRRPAASVEGRRKRPCPAPRIKVGA